MTSPGPSSEVDMAKNGEGVEAVPVELEEQAEHEEPGNEEAREVSTSTRHSASQETGLVEELSKPEAGLPEAEPEEILAEEVELEPEPRKAHSEDLDSDERLSPGTVTIQRLFVFSVRVAFSKSPDCTCPYLRLIEGIRLMQIKRAYAAKIAELR